MLVFHFHTNRRGCVIILKTWWKGFLNESECRLLEFPRNVHISQVEVS